MYKKRFLFLLFTFALIISCSLNNLPIDDLPVIDVTKNYLEKEIVLTEIADVTYILFNSKYDDFLYRGTINYVTESTIVVKDASSGSILFFSKDGAPISRFNRYGNGPEEYFIKYPDVVYDEEADDVFIYGSMPFIQVYSSKGEYKRKLVFPPWRLLSIRQMDIFDDKSLIVFDEGRRLYKAQPKSSKDNMDYLTHTVDSSYYLISKTDGQVIDYIPMPFSQIDLFVKTPSGGIMGPMLTGIVKHSEGFLLCSPETDTVFLYSKNKTLMPVFCKIPLVRKLDPKIILNNCLDSDKYQFFEVQSMIYGQLSRTEYNKYYVRDKKTGKIYRQKIVLPDYKGKDFIIAPNLYKSFHENGTHIELDLFELKLAYREKRLSGKLKELVSKLNELKDNNVYMFIKFK